MDFEMEDPEVIEIYTTGKSSKRQLNKGVAEKLVMRILQVKCANTHNDLIKSAPLNYDGSSFILKDNWRIEVNIEKYHCVVGKIFEVASH